LEGKAGILSGGQKQMLAIARPSSIRMNFYSLTNPPKDWLLIVIDHLIVAIQKLQEQTMIILVEQNFLYGEQPWK